MTFPISDFTDVLVSNEQFVREFQHSELTGTARKGLAVVTCMDSRISPLAVVGMQAGDAKILRNAGARVTDDVLRTLSLPGRLLHQESIQLLCTRFCKLEETSCKQVTMN